MKSYFIAAWAGGLLAITVNAARVGEQIEVVLKRL